MENLLVEPTPEKLTLDQLKKSLSGLMDVVSIRVLSDGANPTVEFAGFVQGSDVDFTFDEILARFEVLGYTPVLTRDGDQHLLKAFPMVIEKRTGKPWVNALLFVLTLFSVLFIGALNAGASPLDDFSNIWVGLPFAATLLGILTAHELSHYFVGRRYGSPVSLPYFIPLPLSLLGTMGAVIVQRGPMRSRKALFDIGAAGPLGGLIVAVPLLIVGLFLSEVQPLPVDQSYYMEGNSLFYFLAKLLIFGQALPSGNVDVFLHPIAFAAWAGLMITALNLFPVGQFDGGHITYAMWGQNAWKVARVFVFLMYAWGLFLNFSGNDAGWTWVIWGFFGLLMGPKHPAPLNDLTTLDPHRKLLGWIMVGIFVLILVPIPLVVVNI